MMPVAEVHLGSIGRMTQLGSGGQGKVFDVPDLRVPGETGPFVYKQYKDKVILGHESAIKNGMGRLVAVRAADPRMTSFMDRISIWPLAVVLPAPGSPGACGILMRKFPQTCRYPLRLPTQTKTVDFTVSQYFRTGADAMKVGLPAMGDEDRWMFLLRAAMFIQKLHSRDVIFGDLSSNNVVINYDRARKGKIYLPMFIDTDGCRIRGEQAAFKQLNTPGWEPPEIRAALDQVHQEEARPQHRPQRPRSRRGPLLPPVDGDRRLQVRPADPAVPAQGDDQPTGPPSDRRPEQRPAVPRSRPSSAEGVWTEEGRGHPPGATGGSQEPPQHDRTTRSDDGPARHRAEWVGPPGHGSFDLALEFAYLGAHQLRACVDDVPLPKSAHVCLACRASPRVALTGRSRPHCGGRDVNGRWARQWVCRSR